MASLTFAKGMSFLAGALMLASCGSGGRSASRGDGGAATRPESNTGGNGNDGNSNSGSSGNDGSNSGNGNGGNGNGGNGNGGNGNGGNGNGGNGNGGVGNGGNGNGGVAAIVTPGDPGGSDVTFTIDTTIGHPISPYVYGTNDGDLKSEAKGLTMTRIGGNRLTAYNWETNASNAGSDYQYENDDFLGASKVAGAVMKQAVTAATSAGASIIMTVPIAGWVAADENGPCNAHPPDSATIAQRFLPIVARKGSPFSYPPNTTDGKVYADEFVAWLESQFPTAQTDATRRIFYMLDNEPDLWSSTHSEIHPNPVTYAEIVADATSFATAIKGVAPKALVFGPASFGWSGYVSLQGAPDANNRDFLEYYLDSMKAAEQTNGKRLLDVLDVHWYPEATGGGNRITDDGTSAAEVDARLQAPRSLWDPTYTEASWITDDSTHGPIELIPLLMKKISAHYPGTKLSISEYNYGAGADISGGLAEADALGVFGREGLFAAATWLVSKVGNTFLFGGFALYRNYDGHGGTFGDTSVDATTSDVAKASVYASTKSADGADVIVVAINKTTAALEAGITLRHAGALASADVYTLTSANPSPIQGAAVAAVAANAFSYTMPPHSATTLVFHP